MLNILSLLPWLQGINSVGRLFSAIQSVTLFVNTPAERNIDPQLKGLAQAKIIKKSVILFRVLNMTI